MLVWIKKYSLLTLSISLLTSCSTSALAQKYLTNKYSDKVSYKKSSFFELQNWNKDDQLKSFDTFKKSCDKILSENMPKYADWVPVCKKAVSIKLKTSGEARLFFEHNFTPYQIIYNNKDTGTFTGYYEPTIKGSLVKTLQYTVPIYKTPKDLVKLPKYDDTYSFGRYSKNKFIPYYSREEIAKGNLFKKADVLVWVKSKVDRSFLQIQGSGRIETDSGDVLLGYDSQNGHGYKPICKYLIYNNYIPLENMSMQSIKAWLNKNKDKIDEVLNYDPSFVFFRYIDAKNAIGAQGVELTPGYSMAIDNDFYPYGVPMWLETDYFEHNNKTTEPLDRFWSLKIQVELFVELFVEIFFGDMASKQSLMQDTWTIKANFGYYCLTIKTV